MCTHTNGRIASKTLSVVKWDRYLRAKAANDKTHLPKFKNSSSKVMPIAPLLATNVAGGDAA